MKTPRYILADFVFLIGHNLVRFSAKLMGYDDIAEELKGQKARWLKEEAFRK